MASPPKGRRSHRKSRAGCTQCKRRKIKCDEGKPGCANCLKHGVNCSFLDPSGPSPVSSAPQLDDTEPPVALSGPESSGSTIDSVMSPTPPAAQQILPSLPQLPPIVPASVDVLDLELLHHYTTSTCYTLSRSPAVQAVWRDEAPRIGFSTPPVLQAVLALSALHLARSRQPQGPRFQAQALLHHRTALHAIVPMVASLAQNNGAGLFLFSTLTCMFSCAKPAREGNFLLFERGSLSDWARFFRGTKTIIQSGGEDLTKGALAPIFMNGAFRAAAHQSPEALEQGKPYVWELQEMIRKVCSGNPNLLRVYQEALDELARTLALTMKPDSSRMLDTADVFRWLLDVTDEYLDLARQEEPIALIIFAYWCVAIRQIEWMWWMDGLSSLLLSQLYHALDQTNREWLRWPDEVINCGLFGPS